jgi:hypothetical protein
MGMAALDNGHLTTDSELDEEHTKCDFCDREAVRFVENRKFCDPCFQAYQAGKG